MTKKSQDFDNVGCREILRDEKNISIPTLIIQPEGIYWIAFLEDEPSVRWTGKNAGDAIQHYVDTMHPGEETVALKIKRRISV